MNHPSISIIGAPKSGTSSVHFWLSRFDEVCAAQPKETFFFVDADCPMKNAKCNLHEHGLEKYSGFFQSPGERLTLDSTTHYFYQATAREHFARANTSACVILRDPVRRIVSYFQYLCLTQAATRQPLKFDDYVDRLLANNVDSLKDQFFKQQDYYALSNALDHGRYVEHVEKWMDAVSQDDFLIVVFEEMVSDKEKALTAIGHFFGLKPGPEHFADFKKENETVNVKFPALNRLARLAGKAIPGEGLKKQLRDFYFRIQRKETPNLAELYPNSIQQLVEYYEPFNRELAERYKVDISRWSVNDK